MEKWVGEFGLTVGRRDSAERGRGAHGPAVRKCGGAALKSAKQRAGQVGRIEKSQRTDRNRKKRTDRAASLGPCRAMEQRTPPTSTRASARRCRRRTRERREERREERRVMAEPRAIVLIERQEQSRARRRRCPPAAPSPRVLAHTGLRGEVAARGNGSSAGKARNREETGKARGPARTAAASTPLRRASLRPRRAATRGTPVQQGQAKGSASGRGRSSGRARLVRLRLHYLVQWSVNCQKRLQ